MWTVGDLMTRNVLTIRPETTLGQAVTLMTQHGITALPVVSASGELLGLISDFQLLPVVYQPELQAEWVGDHMVREVECTTEETPVADLSRQFFEQRLRRLPVLRDRQLVGLISRTHFMRHARQQMAIAGNQSRPAPVELNRPRLLLVSDDSVNELLYRRILELAFGNMVQVDFASDAGAALDDVRSNQTDLIVVDLAGETHESLDLLEHLRAINPLAQIVLVFGRLDLGDISRAMQAGALQVLSKPVSRQELVDVVQEAYFRWQRWSRIAEKAAELIGA
jgi:CBS domain-containing protein/CheY-like chemotaxis protein